MSLRHLAARAGTAANAASRRRFISASSMAQQGRAFSSTSAPPKLSEQALRIKDFPRDEPNDVVFQTQYGLRSIILNRPQKLNSLNGSMIRKIVPRLIEWEKSNMANIVVLKGAGEKALCAGGDVVALAEQNLKSEEGWKISSKYFGLEYKLDHYIATYRKPYIAIMDGITMGGGVGLSVHAPFRIATEKTVFAMPETTIGFFPDVGASFFLPRMNGSVGTFLALTSERLTGANVFYSGIATHYLHSTSLPDLEARLAELRFGDHDSLPDRLASISRAIEEFSTGLPYGQPWQISGEIRNAIDRCFNKGTIDEIIAALQEERGATEEWARKQLSTLYKRSPTAVHVTLEQMRRGKDWDIAQAFTREHQIAAKFMQHHDFNEGVMSLLRHKKQPNWEPESLDAIPKNEDVAEPFLEFDESQSLQLFTDRTYTEYPFKALGVPTETEIQKAISGNAYSPAELVRAIVLSRNNRQGIKEVVEEIMQRKTTVDANGKVAWIKEGTTTPASRL